MTLRAQVAVGRGMEELRRLQGEVEDLRERVGLYQGRYHATVIAN